MKRALSIPDWLSAPTPARAKPLQPTRLERAAAAARLVGVPQETIDRVTHGMDDRPEVGDAALVAYRILGSHIQSARAKGGK